MIYLLLALIMFSAEFQKGFSYGSWWHDEYNTTNSDSCLALLKQTHTEWISVIVTWYQDTKYSTTIYRDTLRTPDDDGVIRVINRAHSLGMKVMLKPQLDCQNWDPRCDIEFYNESDWQAWFASYTQFITYYADIASNNGVEQFCVGTELTKTVRRESDWRTVIDSVKAHFSGKITYAANWYPEEYDSVGFWDVLDYAGIDAYFELTDSYNPSFNSLLGAWIPWVESIEMFYNNVGKQIIFTEIGYRSVDGANIQPWNWWAPGPVDLQEQADCYEATFITFWQKPWWYGVYWWVWRFYEDQGGDTCTDYTPHNKPAEDTLKKWYQIIGTEEKGELKNVKLNAYPNPFSQKTTIDIRVETGNYRIKESLVFLSIYDSGGRLVKSLPITNYQSLITRITWTPKELKSGVYFAKLEIGKYNTTEKLILIKFK